MVVNDLQVLVQAGNQFGCIYADPPWQYDRSLRGAASRHYQTMSMLELMAMPVQKIGMSGSTPSPLDDSLIDARKDLIDGVLGLHI